MDNEVLILRIAPNDGLTRDLKSCKVEAYYKTDYNNLLLRIIRKFKLYFLIEFFLGNWKDEIRKYNTVILFDNGYHRAIVRYIRKNNPNSRIILWFWNVIFDENKKYLNDKEIDEVWSYDKNDCKRYGLNYNTQFYNKSNIITGADNKYDLVFVGTEKRRRKIIDKVVAMANREELRVKIIIPEKKEDRLDYRKYMVLISTSKAILEIVVDGAIGLTLRSLEGVSCGKKLVTNNFDIMNYDFYCQENIFVLGKDNADKLKEFIDAPYKKINKEIVDYYEFENWLKRFNNKEIK